jgi:transcriptional regulator with XRE-family HTH domain
MPMNPVAERIQSLLDERKEKLKPVADAIGVNYYSVYPWWQREASKADYEKVSAFADYFGVPVGHLAYGDPLGEQAPSSERLIARIETLESDDRIALEKYLDFLTSNSNQK